MMACLLPSRISAFLEAFMDSITISLIIVGTVSLAVAWIMFEREMRMRELTPIPDVYLKAFGDI